jgi:peptide/nickel transport system ATP-binding protein
VLRGIDLDATAGELLAVVGRSGAGKTTLGRCLAGLSAGRGSISVDGERLPAAVTRRSVAQRRAVQYVHQDPRATFLEHRPVLDQVARPAVLLRGETAAAARSQAAGLLDRLGLDPATSARRPRALSGGQLQRTAVARALAARPAVLVCDEVTAALDAGNQEELVLVLDDLRRHHGTTVLLISHDRALVRTVADRIAVIEDGLVVAAADRGVVG